jgi:hypothetical protein
MQREASQWQRRRLEAKAELVAVAGALEREKESSVLLSSSVTANIPRLEMLVDGLHNLCAVLDPTYTPSDANGADTGADPETDSETADLMIDLELDSSDPAPAASNGTFAIGDDAEEQSSSADVANGRRVAAALDFSESSSAAGGATAGTAEPSARPLSTGAGATANRRSLSASQPLAVYARQAFASLLAESEACVFAATRAAAESARLRQRNRRGLGGFQSSTSSSSASGASEASGSSCLQSVFRMLGWSSTPANTESGSAAAEGGSSSTNGSGVFAMDTPAAVRRTRKRVTWTEKLRRLHTRTAAAAVAARKKQKASLSAEGDASRPSGAGSMLGRGRGRGRWDAGSFRRENAPLVGLASSEHDDRVDIDLSDSAGAGISMFHGGNRREDERRSLTAAT